MRQPQNAKKSVTYVPGIKCHPCTPIIPGLCLTNRRTGSPINPGPGELSVGLIENQGPCGPGNAYTLEYTPTPGVSLKVTGGFDGGGETPSDVNEFLTYANPIAAQTTLRAGKTPFPLIIFYGATIDPPSFTATLNGANISRRFKPIPGRYQVIPLKFALGSNTLIPSVQGKTAGGHGHGAARSFGSLMSRLLRERETHHP